MEDSTTGMKSFTTKTIEIVNATDSFNLTDVDSSTDVTQSERRTTPEPYGLWKYIEIYEKVNTVLTWALIALVASAILGNVLIVVVMTSKLKRKTSYSPIFVALAVSDLIVIVFGPFDRIFVIFTKYNLKTGVVLQKVKTVVLYTAAQLSSWLLVFLTVERVLSVAKPFGVKYICGKRMKLILFIAIFTLLASYNTVVYTVFLEIIIYPDGYILTVEVHLGTYLVKIWTDACLLFFVPVVVMITGSSYIIYNRSFSRSGETLRSTASRNSSSVTKILLSSVFVFIFTMTPFHIYTFLHVIDRFDSFYLNLTFFDALSFLIDLNSALNVYIYFLTGTQFRKDVRETFRHCRRRLKYTTTKNNSKTQVVSSIQTP